jgi:hypothetical protein
VIGADVTTKNQKYAVVKMDDIKWRDHPSAPMENQTWPRTATITEEMLLTDASVIRGQDIFAAPALWAYANTIGTVARVLKDTLVTSGPQLQSDALALAADNLQDIADYFSQQAEDAAHTAQKLPD